MEQGPQQTEPACLDLRAQQEGHTRVSWARMEQVVRLSFRASVICDMGKNSVLRVGLD